MKKAQFRRLLYPWPLKQYTGTFFKCHHFSAGSYTRHIMHFKKYKGLQKRAQNQSQYKMKFQVMA